MIRRLRMRVWRSWMLLLGWFEVVRWLKRLSAAIEGRGMHRDCASLIYD